MQTFHEHWDSAKLHATNEVLSLSHPGRQFVHIKLLNRQYGNDQLICFIYKYWMEYQRIMFWFCLCYRMVCNHLRWDISLTSHLKDLLPNSSRACPGFFVLNYLNRVPYPLNPGDESANH